MNLKAIFAFLNPARRRRERNEGARAEMRANAEKALRLKLEGDTGTRIPPHRTAHEGMRDAGAARDRSPPRDAAFTPGLKRAAVARNGDAS